MSKKHIVSLHGSYFANNFGDILLINVFYEWIKEYLPSVQVNLPLANKKRTKELPEPTSTGILNLLMSDCLIYCGGGYFGEQPVKKGKWSVRNFFRHAIIGILAVVFRIPIAIIGVEIGPLSKVWFRRVVLWLVKRSRVVMVRNVESFVFLKSNGFNNAVITADAVLSLNQNVEQNMNLDKPNEYITLHLPGYRRYKQPIDVFVASLCECVQKEGKDFDFQFIEDVPGQYSTGYEPLYKVITDKGFKYTVLPYSGIKAVIDSVKNSFAVITTKLHVGITAAAYNKRVFSIYAHPKTLRFHQQIGNGSNCIALSQISDYCHLDDKLIQFINSIPPILPPDVLVAALENKAGLEGFIKESIPDVKELQ